MDTKAKIDRVKKIDSEVGELHPLLQELFPKLERVIYVEYTHGPNEMGSDFVIERYDEALETSNFVGVVAKADKILQNFSDVERQIDECARPRLIRQGTQTVRLPEVWVVTSKTVSQNAKAKISDMFSTRKIYFFDSAWLSAKIDKHIPYFWEELSSTIGAYLSSLDKRLAVISSQTAVTVIGAIAPIIELDIQEVENDRYRKNQSSKRPRLVNILEEVEGNKISLIEASMGFGKSHVARRIAGHFASAGKFRNTKIAPVFASFKQFSESNDRNPEEFAKSAMGDECFRQCIQAESIFLLILDGVDEASSELDICRDTLQQLVKDIKVRTNYKLLLTSRPLKTFDEIEDIVTSAKRYQIRQLSIAKIINYLQQVLTTQSLPSSLLRDLGKSTLFRQLPQNPIAATLLANLISQEKYELPSNLTELYAKTIELMLGRWDERRHISTEKLYRATERIARYIAKHMLDNKLIYLSKTEFRNMTETFLGERNTGVPADEVINYLLDRSHLFGTFDETEAVFFRHRSFAEFLYARDAYETREFPILQRAFEPYWNNTLFFYIGSLGECPELLTQLVQAAPELEQKRFLRMFVMGSYLLAGYQTPYRVIEESLDLLLIEAAQLYMDTRDGRAGSKLMSLSEMQLLWFFTMMMKFAYGYEFFSKALPIAMLKIDESVINSPELKNYALFFAAAILDEVEDKCGYEFLVERRKVQDLPLAISLALSVELSEAGNAVSRRPEVKKFEKTLKKVMTSSTEDQRASNARLTALYEQPLSLKINSQRSLSIASGKTKQSTPTRR